MSPKDREIAKARITGELVAAVITLRIAQQRPAQYRPDDPTYRAKVIADATDIAEEILVHQGIPPPTPIPPGTRKGIIDFLNDGDPVGMPVSSIASVRDNSGTAEVWTVDGEKFDKLTLTVTQVLELMDDANKV